MGKEGDVLTFKLSSSLPLLTNNRDGKDQRVLQENWRYQGNISCKDGHDKGRNDEDLTETKEIKKR